MKRKFKCILIGIIAVLSLGAYAAVLLKPTAVDSEVVKKGNLENHFTVQATILPQHSTILNSVVSGNVLEIPYEAGRPIKKGEVLLRTDAVIQTTLDIQREQLRQQLSSARQTYDRLFGTNGTVLSTLKLAKAQYDLAEKSYDNGKTLAKDGGFLAESDLDALKNQRDVAYQAYLQANENNSESSRSYYKAQIDSCEKQLALLEDTVSPGEIQMPYDGILWEMYVDTGTYLASNQPVAKVYREDEMKLEASILSQDAGSITPGLIAEVLYADGTKDSAEVSFVSKTASQQMSSIGMEENRCIVELKPTLLPQYAGAGQKADATFTIVIAESVITVPSAAILYNESENMIYVIRNRKAEPLKVETGQKEGGRVEILSGIKEGDIIIADPYNNNISKGSRVTAILSE